jgi:hypothetical protein
MCYASKKTKQINHWLLEPVVDWLLFGGCKMNTELLEDRCCTRRDTPVLAIGLSMVLQ